MQCIRECIPIPPLHTEVAYDTHADMKKTLAIESSSVFCRWSVDCFKDTEHMDTHAGKAAGAAHSVAPNNYWTIRRALPSSPKYSWHHWWDKNLIERLSNLTSTTTTQKASWSDYNSHNTAKHLVCIDPFMGVFTLVSPGLSGNASDSFTVEHSGFLDNLKAQLTYTCRQKIYSSWHIS